MTPPGIVELADLSTWPREFRQVVDDVVSRGPLEDQWLTGGLDDGPFIAALSGNHIRTYHCSRLTPTEVRWVKDEGLHPVSAELVERKLSQAVEDGHLSTSEGELYSANHLARQRNRAGAICLIGDRVDLENVPAVGWLLSIWGGEVINAAFHTRSPESQRLEEVGMPTIVVALLDPAKEISYAHPGIALSAARRVTMEDPGTELRTIVTLGPERIEAIHHPGSEFWEQYVLWTP